MAHKALDAAIAVCKKDIDNKMYVTCADAMVNVIKMVERLIIYVENK